MTTKNPAPENPRVNDTWIDDTGELNYWDGSTWVRYEDPLDRRFIYKDT